MALTVKGTIRPEKTTTAEHNFFAHLNLLGIFYNFFAYQG
jgi:hypothetical protein